MGLLSTTFPGAGPGSDVHWVVWRDGQVIMDTILPDGAGLDIPRPLAISQMTLRSIVGPQPTTKIGGTFRLQGSSSVFKVQVEPTTGLRYVVEMAHLQSIIDVSTGEILWADE